MTEGLFAGGTERQIVELLRGMKAHGRYRTALVILKRGGQLEEEAIGLADKFLPVSRRSRLDFISVYPLVKQAGAIGVNLIHTFGMIADLSGLAAGRWLRLPLINGSIRSALPHLPWYQQVSRWCALQSDAIVANSQAGLAAYGLTHHPRARVIHNGIDLKRFSSFNSETGYPPTLCMVANFSPYKDHATVIRALPGIRRAFPETRLLMVGRDAGTLAEHHRLAAELDLTSAVEFITNTSRPEPFIARSQVCLLTSTQGEGFSNAILEYMALSKPVIATDSGGNPELVQHSQTGFLIPAYSPDAVTERVIELLQAPSRAQHMGKCGRQRVETLFSLERMITAYEALYDQLLGHKQQGY